MDIPVPTLLVIEDEIALRTILVDKLTQVGYKTLQAENGKVGLLLAIEKQPDLILLDLLMPVMSGVETITKIRSHPQGKDLKIMVITNMSSAEAMPPEIEEHIVGHFIKSDWSLGELVKKIQSILQNDSHST